MINQISVNSNNTIQLSRGQLLAWLNDLLNINITKIEQLGAGAIYCQMLDVLYPGKIQLSKVNFKAKNDYEYINNFKILQQYFTKFGIMKHIEVEKLIKCKYQDNLQFLQWFKKIFDNSHTSKQDYDVNVSKRSVSDSDNQSNTQKQNKKPIKALNFNGNYENSNNQNGINDLLKLQFSKQSTHQKPSYSSTSRNNQKRSKHNQNGQKPSTERHSQNNETRQKESQTVQNQQLDVSNINYSGKQVMNPLGKEPFYSPSKYIENQNFYKISDQNNCVINEEKEFYLKKYRQIQHLLQTYEGNQSCRKLVGEIRKIILIPPQTNEWTINEQTGQVQFLGQTEEENSKLASINVKSLSKFEEGQNVV